MTVTVFTNPNNPQCEATEQIKNAGFKQIPVVISPNSSWSGHRPDLIRQLAQSIAA